MGATLIPKWRPQAWEDVEGHAISVGSAGQRFLDRVVDTVKLLCQRPELGGAFETTNPRLVGIRAKLITDFHRYVIFYRVDNDAIEVVRVLGGGQDMYAVIDAEA
jgi:plasmid stabilization system protein ParE